MTKVFSQKVKIEHESSPRSKGPRLTTPLYMTTLKLNDGMPISHKEFTKQYGLLRRIKSQEG